MTLLQRSYVQDGVSSRVLNGMGKAYIKYSTRFKLAYRSTSLPRLFRRGQSPTPLDYLSLQGHHVQFLYSFSLRRTRRWCCGRTGSNRSRSLFRRKVDREELQKKHTPHPKEISIILKFMEVKISCSL